MPKGFYERNISIVYNFFRNKIEMFITCLWGFLKFFFMGFTYFPRVYGKRMEKMYSHFRITINNKF